MILMGRSCGSPAQVTALIDAVRDITGRKTLFFIDQEGGRVRRLRPPEWPDFPAPCTYLPLYKQDPELGREAVWLHHRLMAAELAPMGMHADCAPWSTFFMPDMHKIVGDRAFGETAEQVAVLAQAALEGLAEAASPASSSTCPAMAAPKSTATRRCPSCAPAAPRSSRTSRRSAPCATRRWA